MADTYTKEELIEIYRGLPEEVKDALFSPETTDVFDAIKEKQHLTDEQREVMSVYTGFLMMGILPPEKYVPTLITKMGIEREKVASIAQTINRDLFNPIKDILKRVQTGQKSAVVEKPTVISTEKAVLATEASKESSIEARKGVAEIPPETTVTPRATPMMVSPETTKPRATPAPIAPPPPMNTVPVFEPTQKETSTIDQNNPQTDATQPHIGSIFEQKLGGEFRLKSDAVSYTDQSSEESENTRVATPASPIVQEKK